MWRDWLEMLILTGLTVGVGWLFLHYAARIKATARRFPFGDSARVQMGRPRWMDSHPDYRR